jgi:MOSC domain-containing protein
VPSSTVTPHLANIRLHPIKSLDPVSVCEARIGPSGGLALDRAWALYSVDGKWVNGKRTPAIHLIRANYPPDLSSVTLSVSNDRRNLPTRSFAFPGEYENAAEWFSVFFEQQIIVRYSPDGFPDDSIANGPTIVSTASLQAVADWFTPSLEGLAPSPEGGSPGSEAPPPQRATFPGLSLENVRRRFRTTLELHGVPAFWEDQLFGQDERSVIRFTIGQVHLEGSNPCARCPVPPRDPRTGQNLDGFQKHFTRQREATLPPWSPRDRFDHFYRLSTNTRVASTESQKLLRVNDPLQFP